MKLKQDKLVSTYPFPYPYPCSVLPVIRNLSQEIPISMEKPELDSSPNTRPSLPDGRKMTMLDTLSAQLSQLINETKINIKYIYI